MNPVQPGSGDDRMGLHVEKSAILILHTAWLAGVCKTAGSRASRRRRRRRPADRCYKGRRCRWGEKTSNPGGVCTLMRLRDTDKRERLIADAQEALGENTKSGAIDDACRFAVRMAGEPHGPDGQLEELLQLAIEEGSVTPQQIAEVLDTPEVPVTYSREWTVGEE